MTAIELVHEVRRTGVDIVAVGGQIRCRPRQLLGGQLLAELRNRKPEVLAVLRNEDRFPPTPAGWTRLGWADRLRQMSGRCKPIVADRAEWLRQWAAVIEAHERAGPHNAN